MDQFYIILPTVKNLSNFNTQLPVDISLCGTWEVGLSEISFTKSWNTLIENQFVELLTFFYDAANKNIKVHRNEFAFVPSGLYSKQELVAKINLAIAKFIKIEFPNEKIKNIILKKRPEVTIENNKIILKPGLKHNNELIIIRPQIKLCQALGIDYSLIMEKTNNLFSAYYQYYAKPENAADLFREPVIFTSNPIDMETVKSFNVYSDICVPRIVGNQLKQLLRIVQIPEHKKFGEQITVLYTSPQYSRIKSNSFNKILINIKETLKNSEEEEQDNYIPFQFGEVIITLHFRQISDVEIDNSISAGESVPLENPLSKQNPLDVDINPGDTESVVPKKDI